MINLFALPIFLFFRHTGMKGEKKKMPISIKVDEEDYNSLFKMRARKKKSVRLVIKALLLDNESMKNEIRTLKKELERMRQCNA